MADGVLDAGVAIGWIARQHRSLPAIERLFQASRNRRIQLAISLVNLAEVIRHTREGCQRSGADPLVLLEGAGVELIPPDEKIVREVASLPTSLADGFAAATARVLHARLHTADRELARQLRRLKVHLTLY